MATLHNLFEHWLICHQWFEEDKRYLKYVYELSYEDYIKAPRKYREELAAFIGTNAPRDGMEEISAVYNQRYLERWSNLLTNSPWKPWNNKFQLFDRTLLMFYYRILGKKITLTVHNVNAGKRDLNDSFLNRLSLGIQYNLCDHIFVHTDGMKHELVADFCIPESNVSVIPFGINNTVPSTSLSSAEAKRHLGVSSTDKTMLFFGNIAPYKGLEYLISAFAELLHKDRSYRLIIVGRPKGSEGYWKQIQRVIARSSGVRDRVIERIEYIPDEETELFFKATDVLILPYTQIFQSGVLFLGYAFGLPVIAADVGLLREDVIEGKTGFVCQPRDPTDLAKVIRKYFDSELFHNLQSRRAEIKAYANERYSWEKVATITTSVYAKMLR